MENFSNNKCHVISYLFSNLLQLFLEGLSIMILMGKRNLETPQRPWLVWIFDVGKQIIGKGFTYLSNHGIYVFIFKNNSGDKYVWYFINLFVDNTLGLIIVYISHYLLCQLSIYYFGEKSSCSKIGYYGDSPNYTTWLMQMIPYLVSLLFNKVITVLLLSEIHPLLSEIENQIFFMEYPRKQFVFTVVMFICPWILRTLQLMTFDTILRDISSDSEKNIFQKKENTIISSERESKQTIVLEDVNTYSQLSYDEENSDSETKITI